MELSDRQTKILRHLADADSWVENRGLTSTLGNAGRETVRKEISALEAEGLVERAHGKTRVRSERLTRELLKILGLLSRGERREEILALLERNRSIRIATLAGMFHVSEATIRNDIADLLPSDRVAWRYGKVHYLPPPRGQDADVVPSDFSFPDAVQHMADRASQFITFGDRVYLDSSLCCLCILTRIDVSMELDIFTESLKIALMAAGRRMKAKVHVLGGQVDPASLTAGEPCTGLASVGKAFAGVTADADGTLRHRSVPGASILERTLPRECTMYFHLDDAPAPERTDAAGTIFPGRGAGGEKDEGPHSLSGTHRHPGLGLDPDRIGEIVFPSESAALEACAASGIPASIARESHVVLNPLGRTRRIGVATLDASHEFSQRFIDNLQSKIRRLPDLRFLIADNRMDSDTTLANLDLFVRERADIIIEYQHEHRLGKLIAERMCRAGIPILAVDVAIPGAYYFGANNYEAGRIAGSELATIARSRWPGEAVDLLLVTDRGAGETSENRVAGTVDAFREAFRLPDRRISVLDSQNDPLNAENVVFDHFGRTGSRACAIACVNANLAIGAIRAVQRLGLANVAIAAHNDTLEIMKELADPASRLAGVVAYHPETYGERILALAERLLEGRAAAPSTFVEHTWIPARTRDPADLRSDGAG